MTMLRVAINAINPGEYLAVCGLVELVSRMDRSAASAWTRRSGVVPDLPKAMSDLCEIQTNLAEVNFADKLSVALSSREAWSAVAVRGRVPLADAATKWTAGIEFKLPDCGVILIDHWYERAFVNGEQVLQRQGKHDGKSRWKFWAGQQDSNKGITGLLLDLIDASAGMKGMTRVQDILAFTSRGSSRLNLDAAATRSSIDRGISANDASADGGSGGRPGLELLAAIGISAFFPPRRYGNAAPDGTVAVHKRLFRYCTWTPLAPIGLARLCARGVGVIGFDCIPHAAEIGMIGQYSYLRFARAAGVGVAAIASEESASEDTTEENANE